MNPLRAAVMDKMDEYHEKTDGSTPDHIIVSEATWRDMKENSKFEKLGSTDVPKRRNEHYGFMGMRVWKSEVLDDTEAEFMLLSEQNFRKIMPTVADLREAEHDA